MDRSLTPCKAWGVTKGKGHVAMLTQGFRDWMRLCDERGETGDVRRLGRGGGGGRGGRLVISVEGGGGDGGGGKTVDCDTVDSRA